MLARRGFLFNAVAFTVAIFVTLLGLNGCDDYTAKRQEALRQIVSDNFVSLETQIREHKLPNIKILREYLVRARDLKPQYTELIDGLAIEIGLENPHLESLRNRFSSIGSIVDVDDRLAELTALAYATTPEIYNESLIDTINTLADLTEGVLRKVQASDNQPAGSRLIGNPAYGEWQNRNGQNIWIWYGRYRLFGDLFFRPQQYKYHSWYYERPWSYYHDYGRDIYGSKQNSNDYERLRQQEDAQINQYGQRTGRHPSSYARRINGVFRPSHSTTVAKSSPYVASMRNDRSTGRFGGK